MNTYDVTVIGAGPGGYVAAIRAAQRGARVALIEKEYLGGTCLNWGCIPTKSLIHAAEMIHDIRHSSRFGVVIEGEPRADWTVMQKQKDTTVRGLRKGIQALVKSNGIDLYQGAARFTGRHSVTVRSADDAETAIDSSAVIIATGSQTVTPDFIPRADNILYSRDMLSAPALPETLIVLGGGVIGCEFACMYAQLGVKATLVEMLPRILPFQDADIAKVVQRSMAELGITVLTDTKLEAISSDGATVTARAGERTLKASQLLVCVGRRPYSDGLDLQAAGLHLDDSGHLPVDPRCRTRVPGIYAIGDLTGAMQFAHRASSMGICAANNATGQPDTHTDAYVPSCIFTRPQIGAVGLTQEQAEDQGYKTRTGTFSLAALGKAQILRETDGVCKIITDARTDQVLGVHIVGPNATDLVAEAATAMNLEITAEELGRAVHAHPTLSEMTMEAAHAVHHQCIHMPPRKQRSTPRA